MNQHVNDMETTHKTNNASDLINLLTGGMRARAKSVFIVGTFILILCIISTYSHSTSRIAQHPGTPEQWEDFLRCSENEGDAGCDSCFYKVFGYRAEEPGYLRYNKE